MTVLNRREFTLLAGAAALSASIPSASDAATVPDAITPFKISVADASLQDLRQRLEVARWPEAVATDWSRGQPVPFVRMLANQWRQGFDWRKQEARLNSYPQFTTKIDGQVIHFLQVKSPEKGALPLIMSHGWPSSIAEFLDVIGPLSDPRAHGLDPSIAFDLIIPSLPGFGFSTPLSSTGWDVAKTAKAWDSLMNRLGYRRYGAQGGDMGALVTRELGILKPTGLVGIHLQQIFAFPTGAPGEMDKLSPFEKQGMGTLASFQKLGVYSQVQSIRPATLSYGLVDSPVGVLGWNAELFFGFGGEAAKFSDRDRYLTHASIYWLTGTSGSAANMYYENAQTNAGYRESAHNDTPTAVAVFPYDFRSVRSFAERANNIVRWTEMPRGGHFAATDAPDLLVQDIRQFFSERS